MRVLASRWTLCLWLLVATGAVADEGWFRLVYAESEAHSGVEQLYLQADLDLPAHVRDALLSGIGLRFSVHIELVQPRQLWLDAVRSRQRLRYRLHYDSVTRLYRVNDFQSGQQTYYRSRLEAVDAIGQLRGWPLMRTEELARYPGLVARVRVALDRSDLPAPLQPEAYLTQRWNLQTGWREWAL